MLLMLSAPMLAQPLIHEGKQPSYRVRCHPFLRIVGLGIAWVASLGQGIPGLGFS
jgi:hypothetical protein